MWLHKLRLRYLSLATNTRMDKQPKEPLAARAATFIAAEIVILGAGLMFMTAPQIAIWLSSTALVWLFFTILQQTIFPRIYRLWLTVFIVFAVLVPFIFLTPVTTPVENRMWDTFNFGTRPKSLVVKFEATPQEDQFLVEVELRPKYKSLFGLNFSLLISTTYQPESVKYRGGRGPGSTEFIPAGEFIGIENQFSPEHHRLDLQGKNIYPSPNKPFYISFLTDDNPDLIDCDFGEMFGTLHGNCYDKIVEVIGGQETSAR